MRLSISKSKNSVSLYVIKSTYENKKNTSKVVEKLGTYDYLKEKLNGEDPIEWAKKYVEELNRKEAENKLEVLVKYSPEKIINKGEQKLFNGGYLFLQKIYYELGIHNICSKISKKYNFEFDLNSILSRLIYSRIVFPASKLATFELSKNFIEQPNFELQNIYRSLDFIAKESDFIQSSIYNNSLKISKRNTGVLYYDCTNFFFEIEQPDDENGLRQYGMSKEHRPTPIVQMGLFMDGDGIPLAFSINKGNTNEQTTLQPIEQKLLNDFGLAKFIVCTDAGLASNNNRKFNTQGERAFITTQSIKQLKEFLKEWALDPIGWKLSNDDKIYDLSQINKLFEIATPEEALKLKNKTFFKEKNINENGLEQKLIVTFSFKYRDYQRNIRNSQIERAQKIINSNPKKINKPKQNDFKRFIEKTTVTKDGEIAENDFFAINTALILKEEMFDGFYAVCTNLNSSPSEIIKVNHRRWEIEECFRIMKSEFKARPVYLNRDNRIIAHFTTCFIALIIFRLLEKKLDNKYTCSEIMKGLKDMNFKNIENEGFEPLYIRNDFTDDLHNAFNFRTDYQILTKNKMKNIFNETKK
jgi:transposase